MTQYQKGFTLIELLISVVLVSLMLILASVALRNMLLSWGRLAVPYPKEAVAFHRLQSAINSMMPYAYVQTREIGTINPYTFFFMAEKDWCSFITSLPLAGDGPALVRIFVADKQLTLAETSLYSSKSNYKIPRENETTRFIVLADDVVAVNFQYREKEWVNPEFEYPYPSFIQMTIEKKDGDEMEFYFTVRSDYPEKLQMLLKMDQNA